MMDAHIARDDPERTQPLREHVRAVAARCGETLAPSGLSRLGYLAGLLHDFGKARACFQAYLHETDEHKKRALRGKINHSAAGAQWLAAHAKPGHDPAMQVTLLLLELAITGHHGGLSDCLTPQGEDKLTRRVFPAARIEQEACARYFLQECAGEAELEALLREARDEVRALIDRVQNTSQNAVLLSCQLGLAARLLLSALVDADRFDAMDFDAGGAVSEPAPADAAFWQALAARLESRLDGFPKDGALSASRRAIADACLAAGSRPGGIYRLYAPTGGGKTLSSLRFALEHVQKNRKTRRDGQETPMARIFYIIPYTTIIEQTAKELRDTLGDEDFIVEHHSGILWDGAGEEQELDLRELYTERWTAPIILTTMVQFLNTLFAGRNGCVRRMQGLQNAVLIFDEIQSIPTKCIGLFNAACTFLSRQCGATILLCTATQPALDRANIPLCYDADVIDDPETLFQAFRRTRVVDLRDEGPMDAACLADFCRTRMEEHTGLLVVLNTRSAVKKLFDALRQELDAGICLAHLSTAMCGAHRKKAVREIRRKLERGERVLCVSTQLIEAGVDLSFSCVIRSLAGLENLAQAAGRCNRHGDDPNLHAVYFIQSADEKLKFLQEIREGQRFCAATLAAFAGREADPLSPAMIEAYYRRRYYSDDAQKRMSYPVTQDKSPALTRETSLLELLSVNTPGRQEASHRRPPHTPRVLEQAFATAGDIFQPIDSPTTAVLTPYGEGAVLIQALEATRTPKEEMGLLRRAQPYAVNLFGYELQALEKKGALRELPCGICALDERFYDDEAGVTLEGAEMALLNF